MWHTVVITTDTTRQRLLYKISPKLHPTRAPTPAERMSRERNSAKSTPHTGAPSPKARLTSRAQGGVRSTDACFARAKLPSAPDYTPRGRPRPPNARLASTTAPKEHFTRAPSPNTPFKLHTARAPPPTERTSRERNSAKSTLHAGALSKRSFQITRRAGAAARRSHVSRGQRRHKYTPHGRVLSKRSFDFTSARGRPLAGRLFRKRKTAFSPRLQPARASPPAERLSREHNGAKSTLHAGALSKRSFQITRREAAHRLHVSRRNGVESTLHAGALSKRSFQITPSVDAPAR